MKRRSSRHGRSEGFVGRPEGTAKGIQLYIINQMGELRVPLGDLLSAIDQIVVQGFLGPAEHLTWRSTLSMLDFLESELWRLQTSTNNRLTLEWPDLRAPDNSPFAKFNPGGGGYLFISPAGDPGEEA